MFYIGHTNRWYVTNAHCNRGPRATAVGDEREDSRETALMFAVVENETTHTINILAFLDLCISYQNVVTSTKHNYNTLLAN